METGRGLELEPASIALDRDRARLDVENHVVARKIGDSVGRRHLATFRDHERAPWESAADVSEDRAPAAFIRGQRDHRDRRGRVINHPQIRLVLPVVVDVDTGLHRRVGRVDRQRRAHAVGERLVVGREHLQRVNRVAEQLAVLLPEGRDEQLVVARAVRDRDITRGRAGLVERRDVGVGEREAVERVEDLAADDHRRPAHEVVLAGHRVAREPVRAQARVRSVRVRKVVALAALGHGSALVRAGVEREPGAQHDAEGGPEE